MKLKFKLLSTFLLSIFPFVSAHAEIKILIDPINRHIVYIDGSDTGLIMYQVGSDLLPPPPSSPPKPNFQRIYPSVDTFCKGIYLRPEFASCAPGYFNKPIQRGDAAFCVPSSEQVALCTYK